MNPLSDQAFFEAHTLSQAGAGADRALRVRFFYAPMPDPKATLEKGRPMFRTEEMCEIRVDKTLTQCEPVGKMVPDPRERFPAAYAKFKLGHAQQVEGTLLSKWGVMDPAEAAGYEAIGILTVEQLAALSDAQCQQHRGSLADRQRAKDWLDKARGLEPVAQARAENAQLRAEIEALREAVASLGGKVPEKPAEATKRRGRPPGSKNKPKDQTTE